MAKHIIKRKRRTFKPMGLLRVITVFAVFLSLYTTIFVRTDNNGLLISIQNTQKEMNIVSVENETLKVAVQELRNYAYVVNIANQAGLDNLDNKITVRLGE